MKKVLLFLSILFAATYSGFAQSRTDDPDSTLVGYYRWCNRNKTNPEMPLRADSMFRLAGQRQNRRMQVVALCLRADYFAATNNLDSLRTWVARTQEFARRYDQPTHYYFVWTRLIQYYARFGKYTLALYELEHYREQAEKDDYKPAIAEAYKQLGYIYRTQGLINLAIDNYEKSIEFAEQNNLKEVDVSYIYTQLAEIYPIVDKFDQGLEAIKKARSTLLRPEHIWRVKLVEAGFYLATNRTDSARRLIREIKEHGGKTINAEKVSELERLLCTQRGEYQQALEMIDSQLRNYRVSDSTNTVHYFYTPMLAARASVLAKMGRYKAATDDLLEYISVWRQKVESDTRETLGEFSTLLDVERLDREKADALQQAQAERLRRTQSIISALGVILLLSALFIAVLMRMNRRLVRAKRAAEEANRMKGIFIRNITHEINTPLNAIVGFAELASATPVPDREVRDSYIDIIRENSGYLQKLVDDVLYISDLESSDTPPETTAVNIDDCCRDCIGRAAAQAPPQVELRFEPGLAEYSVRTSRLLVTKVLGELLTNALRNTPEGTVTLACTADAGGGNVRFTVTDPGRGIPPEEAERIFERFVKLDPFSQGLGLGLNVCRLIAAALGGSIYLDTSYTGGARFVFTVPAAQKPRKTAG